MQLCLPHLGGNLSAIYLAVFPSDLSLSYPLSLTLLPASTHRSGVGINTRRISEQSYRQR